MSRWVQFRRSLGLLWGHRLRNDERLAFYGVVVWSAFVGVVVTAGPTDIDARVEREAGAR